MDGCTFGCVLCEPKATFGCIETLGDHLGSAHNVDLSVYAKLRDPIEQVVMFKCLLCNQEDVRQDRKSVTEHLTSKHGTTPEMYRALTAKFS